MDEGLGRNALPSLSRKEGDDRRTQGVRTTTARAPLSLRLSAALLSQRLQSRAAGERENARRSRSIHLAAGRPSSVRFAHKGVGMEWTISLRQRDA